MLTTHNIDIQAMLVWLTLPFMIFAVLDPSPLTVCINCSFLHLLSVKPRLHQQQCRSNNVECYKSNDTSERCFHIFTVFSNNVAVLATVFGRLWQQRCRFWQQCQTKFCPFDKVETNWMFNLFRLCRKDDISRETRSTLLPFLATKSNVASTKSNVASTLLPVASHGVLVICSANCRTVITAFFSVASTSLPSCHQDRCQCEYHEFQYHECRQCSRSQ